MEHNLIRGVQSRCVVCKKHTNLYDLDFDCPVHKHCQDILIQDYLKAEETRPKVLPPKDYEARLRKHQLGEKFVVLFSSKPLNLFGKVLYKINPESNSPFLSNLIEGLMYKDFCISTTFGMGDN